MKKLKECKNFGELYETIGEENFGNVAYFLTLLLIFAPFAAGILNAGMLLYERRGFSYYDAWEYNYKCMTIWNIPYSLMLIWVVIYVACKIGYNKWKFRDFISAIKEKQPWLLWWLALLVWTIIPVAFSPDTFGSIVGTGQLASGYISHFFTLGVLGCVYTMTTILSWPMHTGDRIRHVFQNQVSGPIWDAGGVMMRRLCTGYTTV